MASVGRGAVEGLADFDGTLEAGLRVVEVAEFVLDDAEIVDACGDRRMSGSEFSFGDVDGAEVTHLGLFEEVVLVDVESRLVEEGGDEFESDFVFFLLT